MKKDCKIRVMKETYDMLKHYSTLRKISIAQITREAFEEYLKENKKEVLKKINKTNKVFTRYHHSTKSEKTQFNVRMNNDDYQMIKISANLEHKTITQKIDEIVCDYINKHYLGNS